MKMRILLPTDFSKNAWNALRYAGELYKYEEVDFYILNAFSTQLSDIANLLMDKPGDNIYDVAISHSEKELRKTLKRIKIRDVYPGHTYFTMSLLDSPINAIKKAVELKDIDLVVMGTKGVTNAKAMVYGSHTIEVMEKVRNCPVLAIPNVVAYSEPKEIVFPTSFKTHFKRKELNYLYNIAKLTNANVSVLHVNTEESLDDKQLQNKDLLEEIFDGIEYSFHWLESGSVNEGLDEFVRNRSSDMIVFINKKHTFFDSLFSNLMVKNLGASSQIPLLVLHDLRN